MPWNGSREAQRQADEAWNAVKNKFWRRKKKSKSTPKQKRRAAKQKPVTFVPYAQYIKSRAWARKREKAFRHYGRKCHVCGSTERLIVHHKSYKNLGREPLADLEVLCNGCHANGHEGQVPGVFDPSTPTISYFAIYRVLREKTKKYRTP